MKKYIITDIQHPQYPHLHRIQAVRSFEDVKAGDLGGFIAKEENLSHKGNCWVYHDAIVKQEGRVMENAAVMDQAIVMDDGLVFQNASIRKNAIISESAIIKGKSHITDEAEISGNCLIEGKVFVCGSSVVRAITRY